MTFESDSQMLAPKVHSTYGNIIIHVYGLIFSPLLAAVLDETVV